MKTLTLPFALLSSAILLVSCVKDEAPLPVYEDKVLTLQPGAEDGQDCLVATRETDNDLYASSNHKLNPDVAAIVWTYDLDNAGVGINRTFIKFTGLSEIPADAEIESATLFLYGVESGVAAPLGNSYYPGSPYVESGHNGCWLKRVTGNWSDSTITWNNKPGTTDDDMIDVSASDSRWNFDAPPVDVTNMVNTMVKTGENNGFCLQLQVEEYYRGIVFGSSEHADATKRPKLVVEYSVMKK